MLLDLFQAILWQTGVAKVQEGPGGSRTCPAAHMFTMSLCLCALVVPCALCCSRLEKLIPCRKTGKMPEETGKIPCREATTSSLTPKYPPLQAVCCSENSSLPQPPLQEQCYLFTHWVCSDSLSEFILKRDLPCGSAWPFLQNGSEKSSLCVFCAWLKIAFQNCMLDKYE